MNIQNIINNAKNVISSQSCVPLSPGTISGYGEVEMCFGLAVLATSAQAVGVSAKAIDEWVNEIIAMGDSSAILVKAEEVGANRRLCELAIISNDNFTESERQAGILLSSTSQLAKGATEPTLFDI